MTEDHDHAVHDWYRFVLSFSPRVVRTYLERFGAGARHRVLDPFCGVGTTIVECKKMGIPSIGVDAHPFARFVTQVKSDWTPDPDELMRHADAIAACARERLAHERMEGTAGAHLRTLDPDIMQLCMRNAISPLPLHKALVLLDTIDRHADPRWTHHQRLALARALPSLIGNLHFGPEVGVRRVKHDAPVIDAWLDGIALIARDLRQVQRLPYADAEVHLADARAIHHVVEPESVDIVITSPPYPNEKDYTRVTRLESVMLGFIQSASDLRTIKRTLLCSNTRHAFASNDDDQHVVHHAAIQQLADEIDAQRRSLGKTSGFERAYARVARLYFGGMARHLAHLRTVLRPGAHLAYVVGDQASYFRVLIRTSVLLADIAQRLGYDLVGIDMLRTRMSTATRKRLREDVLVVRWTGSCM